MRRLLLTTALLTTGCSVLFMDKVPDGYRPEQGEPRCSVTSGFIAWDLLVVAASGVSIALGAKIYGAGEITALSVNGLVHGLSALAGSSRQRACGKAREDRDAWMASHTMVPRVERVAVPVDAGVPDTAIDAGPTFTVDPEEPPR